MQNRVSIAFNLILTREQTAAFLLELLEKPSAIHNGRLDDTIDATFEQVAKEACERFIAELAEKHNVVLPVRQA